MMLRVSALLFILLGISNALAETEPDCKALLKEYYQFSSSGFNRQQTAATTPHSSLLYVLRTPATTAPELDQCLARLGVPGSKRCPGGFSGFNTKLEDDLLAAVNQPQKCGVMSSMEDLSILTQLPHDTEVAAHLKDPVQRFISAYELTVEVAAKKLQQLKAGKNPYVAKEAVHPADIWPWSQLSALMLKDMKKRVGDVTD